MNETEYQAMIPHICSEGIENHKRMLLCWGITYGYTAKSHDVEGPTYCHFCELSNMSNRLKKRWWGIIKKRMEAKECLSE